MKQHKHQFINLASSYINLGMYYSLTWACTTHKVKSLLLLVSNENYKSPHQGQIYVILSRLTRIGNYFDC